MTLDISVAITDPAHFKSLRDSGLNDESIAIMGCNSVPSAAEIDCTSHFNRVSRCSVSPIQASTVFAGIAYSRHWAK